MKTVTVTINPTGGVTVDAQGFQGGECKKTTEGILKALGGDAEVKDKPELHMKPKKEGKKTTDQFLKRNG